MIFMVIDVFNLLKQWELSQIFSGFFEIGRKNLTSIMQIRNGVIKYQTRV